MAEPQISNLAKELAACLKDAAEVTMRTADRVA
jgi:hypothetical protein